MEVGESVRGECGYCGERVEEEKEKWLPLECSSCHLLFHLRCLKGARPPVVLRGDRLWLFQCSLCRPQHKETCSRPHLQWVHVIHLVLYHLMVTEEGKNGFFRWNEEICSCIQKHWNSLMPLRKRTQSWHSTVAGTLSVNCPSLFLSGAKQLGESGYWTLTSLSPPEFTATMRVSGSRGLRPPPPPPPPTPAAPCEVDVKREEQHIIMEVDDSSSPPPLPPPPPPVLPAFTSLHPTLSLLSPRQEAILLSHLNSSSSSSIATSSAPKTQRLRRKLKIRQRQRNHGYTNFDLDRYIIRSLSTTVKYIVDKEKPYSEQVTPVTVQNVVQPSPASSSSLTDPYTSILFSISTFPLLPPITGSAHFTTRLVESLAGGCGLNLDPIPSPYTSRLLKPYIFRSCEISPPQVKLLNEIVNHYIRRRPGHAYCHTPFSAHSIDLCYLQRRHVVACNGLLSHFFWSVDISESLTHPDFTCVALYGRLVIGCAFMTPDVKVGEAYISFLLVHPHFAGCGIGKMMLYHLIQSCRGKDVTLHVSVDNPAMLLYQSFGFKAERYCLDFYDGYYPTTHPHSKHAYFMRLHR